MDCTKKLFAGYLESREEIIKAASEKLNMLDDLLKKKQVKRSEYLVLKQKAIAIKESSLIKLSKHFMSNAIFDKGFSLPLSDVCRKLDLDMTYFTERKSVNLKGVNYFVAPIGAAEFFNYADRFGPYHFWERRLLKWKKIFLNREQFLDFLVKHMYIIDGNGNEENITRETAEHLLESKTLYRKRSLKNLLLEAKLANYIRKTNDDITRYYQQKLKIIESAMFPNQEHIEDLEEYIKSEHDITNALKVEDLALTCRTTEVNKFLGTYNPTKYVIKASSEVVLFEVTDEIKTKMFAMVKGEPC